MTVNATHNDRSIHEASVQAKFVVIQRVKLHVPRLQVMTLLTGTGTHSHLQNNTGTYSHLQNNTATHSHRQNNTGTYSHLQNNTGTQFTCRTTQQHTLTYRTIQEHTLTCRTTHEHTDIKHTTLSYLHLPIQDEEHGHKLWNTLFDALHRQSGTID